MIKTTQHNGPFPLLMAVLNGDGQDMKMLLAAGDNSNKGIGPDLFGS